MTYHAPISEITFAADLVGQARLAETERFAEATEETRDAILSEAAKLAQDVIAPVNTAGDIHPARLENGVVRASPGFAEAYRAIADGGWVGMTADPDFGGMGLPQSFSTMVFEMIASACLSLELNPLLTQGQIEALESHADDWIKELYIPKLASGEWTGTMNLTEPQAGSDVGALTTKAAPQEDGTYAISGQKIYISWGDHDVTENITHLVLARLPGSVPGPKGISLFLVPKFIPDAAGNPGVANAVRCIGLEEKMGLHGSPTCTLEFDNATGWMIGSENGGMAAMFTMMNNARLGVGIQGVAIAEMATQLALAYAAERKQGRTADGTASILGHADVRRMLMTMSAMTRVARSICYDCACSIDLAKAAGEAEARTAHDRRAAFLTPIAKAFGTDAGAEVADLGIQVHGGMGYIEQTGAAQLYRDVRVTQIYEGTNGIQALDLVGRKLTMDRGETAGALIGEIAAGAEAAKAAGLDALADALGGACERLAAATEWMLAAGAGDRAAGATPYLRVWALTLGAHYLVRGALTGDAERRALAEFYAANVLPDAQAKAAAATAGAAGLFALSPEALGAA